MELIGGPYDGVKIDDKTGETTDVYRDDPERSEHSLKFPAVNYRYAMLDKETVKMTNPHGIAVYDAEESDVAVWLKRWVYRKGSHVLV